MRCDCCHEQKIIDRWYTNQFIQHETGYFTAQDGSYDTKWDSLLHKTVRIAPYGFLTAQDGAYGTIQDFLPHKTVRTAPNGISYSTKRIVTKIKWKYH
jgi:hypothetical protein